MFCRWDGEIEIREEGTERGRKIMVRLFFFDKQNGACFLFSKSNRPLRSPSSDDPVGELSMP